MPRHAGFAAAATIREQSINEVLASFVKYSLAKRFFPLPQTVNLGHTTVTFGGLVEVLPPHLELHANPNDLVRVHFAFRSRLRGQVSGQPMADYLVELSGSVAVGLTPLVQNGLVSVAINLAQVNLQPLNVQRLSGPALPPAIQAALQSQALAGRVSTFVQSLGLVVVTPPLINAGFHEIVPADFKEAGVSLFEWFRIDLEASRIVIKPLEQAITVAVDFAGYSQGDAAQLVDLTRIGGGGAIYVQTITPHTDPKADPILVPRGKPGGGSIAATVNMGVISAILARQVSARIAGTPIARDVRLQFIRIGYSTFDKPLRGREDGLLVEIGLKLKDVVEVTGRIYIQPYLVTFDGPTGFLRADHWRLSVAKVEIELPGWVNPVVIALSVFLGVTIPILAPITAISAIALIDGIIPGALDNVSNEARKGLRSSLNASLLSQAWSEPLPGTVKPRWDGSLRYFSITPESIDTAIDTRINLSDSQEEPAGVIDPGDWSVYNLAEIPVGLKLRQDLEQLSGNNLMVAWEVRRADTNQVIATAVKSYLDPLGNGLTIPHHSKDLYLVDAYKVRALATITLGSQVGEIWSGEQEITIRDPLNRRFKYLRWGPKRVYFQNAGTKGEWWSHLRRSRIHRTAVAARCKMLRQEAEHIIRIRSSSYVTYSNELPFAWEDMNSHRKVLCEYCFFGGPDKTKPLPKDDWFVPLQDWLRILGGINFKVEKEALLKRFRF